MLPAAGTQLDEVTMFHDGVQVERCTTGPARRPDPCIFSVARVKGTIKIIVFSSENGSWRGGGADRRGRRHECRAHRLFGMIVCQQCGEQNPERFRICGMCGAPLAADAGPARGAEDGHDPVFGPEGLDEPRRAARQ